MWLSRSASRSMACADAIRSCSLSGRSRSVRLPAAARIDASGVRRSWETDSRRAVLRASLRRAISASRASSARRSCSSAWATWSAADASSRVSLAEGRPRARRRVAQSEPSARPPASSVTRRTDWRCRAASCSAEPSPATGAPRARRIVAVWIVCQRAGASPGVRRRQQVARRARQGAVGRRVGQPARPLAGGRRGLAGEPGSVESSGRADDRRDPGERVGRRGPGGQLAADVEHRAGFALAGPGVVRARPELRCQLADEEADHEEQGEVEPLARVVDGERVDGLDEEVVVGQERSDCRDHRAGAPGDERDDRDREHVDGRCVGHARGGLEDRDDQAGDGDRQRPRHPGRGPRRPGWVAHRGSARATG